MLTRSRTYAFFAAVLAGIIILSVLSATGIVGAVEPETFVIEDITIENMTIDVRPEFDTSDVLVMYSATLVNNSGAPYQGEVRFKIPGDAKLSSTCEIKDGEHYCQLPGVLSENDGSKTISWRPSQAIPPGGTYEAYLEFYYDPIVAGGTGNKKIDYVFASEYPTGELYIDVTQPLRSSNFVSDPQPDNTTTVRGMNVYRYKFGPLASNQEIGITLQYNKADSQPSIASREGMGPDAPVSSGGTGKSDPGGLASRTNSGMIALVVVLVGALVYILYSSFIGNKRSTSARSAGARGAGAPGGARTGKRTSSKERAAKDLAGDQGGPLSSAEERKLAKRLLLSGKISEQTYNRLMDDIEKG